MSERLRTVLFTEVCNHALPTVIKISEAKDRLLKGNYKDFDQHSNFSSTTMGQRGICSIVYFFGGTSLCVVVVFDRLVKIPI